jgi:hypothetical protein
MSSLLIWLLFLLFLSQIASLLFARGGSFKEIWLSRLSSAGYRGLGVHDKPLYTADQFTADSTEQYEIPGVSPLSLAERG